MPQIAGAGATHVLVEAQHRLGSDGRPSGPLERLEGQDLEGPRGRPGALGLTHPAEDPSRQVHRVDVITGPEHHNILPPPLTNLSPNEATPVPPAGRALTRLTPRRVAVSRHHD